MAPCARVCVPLLARAGWGQWRGVDLQGVEGRVVVCLRLRAFELVVPDDGACAYGLSSFEDELMDELHAQLSYLHTLSIYALWCCGGSLHERANACRAFSARSLTSAIDTRSQRFLDAKISSGETCGLGTNSGEAGVCHLLVGTPHRLCSSVDLPSVRGLVGSGGRALGDAGRDHATLVDDEMAQCSPPGDASERCCLPPILTSLRGSHCDCAASRAVSDSIRGGSPRDGR